MHKIKHRLTAPAPDRRQRQGARGHSCEQRAGSAGTITERHHRDTHCDEKRQRIYRKLKDQPAERADTECIEDSPKDEYGGYSLTT